MHICHCSLLCSIVLMATHCCGWIYNKFGCHTKCWKCRTKCSWLGFCAHFSLLFDMHVSHFSHPTSQLACAAAARFIANPNGYWWQLLLNWASRLYLKAFRLQIGKWLTWIRRKRIQANRSPQLHIHCNSSIDTINFVGYAIIILDECKRWFRTTNAIVSLSGAGAAYRRWHATGELCCLSPIGALAWTK